MNQRAANEVYVPASQRVGEAECRALLDEVGAGLWITGTDGPPSATLLPTLWRGDRLIAHASGHNAQFAGLEGPVPCRFVVQGVGAYISPRWYPSIQDPTDGGAARGRARGRAVGTWDYRQAQVAGVLTVHRDRERLRHELGELAHLHDELRLADGCPADAARGPWRTSEAPRDFLEAMLRGVVGLELEVREVVGRHKLSQNRTGADRDGVVEGLTARGRPTDLAVAEAVRTATRCSTRPVSRAPLRRCPDRPAPWQGRS
ncbi:FMN-binding negative transcriptional regulator [Tessaracoccus sp. HDW20]|uniref:FMN-binding negative transcriptional regulator n=1 Tax=Tessaracoccus coleopterorum TaxID=2714950 RepID=UPI0018D2F0F3|nr:FMN-binding negative transcriptional regulator [Tessaracoccus coleopterorum]